MKFLFWRIEWPSHKWQILTVNVFIFSVVTLYATLGLEAIIHGVNEAEVSCIITSAQLLARFKVSNYFWISLKKLCCKFPVNFFFFSLFNPDKTNNLKASCLSLCLQLYLNSNCRTFRQNRSFYQCPSVLMYWLHLVSVNNLKFL